MEQFSWTRWLRSLLRPKAGKAYRHKPMRSLSLEPLEDRLTPSTFTWSGGLALQTGNGNWNQTANWLGGVVPTGSATSLDDLVFPSGLSGKALNTVNNLPLVGGAAPTFNSITIAGSGYSLGGSALTLGSPSVIGSGFITASAGALNNSMGLSVNFNGASGNQQFITVNLGASLTISGQVSGTSGSQLTKEGVGTLTLGGNNNGFTGQFTIDNNAGIVIITNANGLGASGGTTTVGTNSQLQVSNVSGAINEHLLLNGPGLSNNGALFDSGGTVTWASTVELDSDSTIGTAAGAVLTIGGTISDLGAGHNLTKEGSGQVIFAVANTYRGLTTINGGILTIENSNGLGASGTPQSGTVVNTSPSEQGTLQLNSTASGGLVVQNEYLTLSGEGFETAGVFLGALDSSNGNNTWTGPVALANPGVVTGYTGPGFIVGSGGQPTIDNYIGVDLGTTSGLPTQLTISGSISSPTGNFGFTKVGFGRLVLTSANTYFGDTSVFQGYLRVSDSQALGVGITNLSLLTTQFVDFGASLELAVDNVPDSVTGTTNTLDFSPFYDLVIGGTGADNAAGTPEGALDSVSGINIWGGIIGLPTPINTPTATSAIGVEPDPNPTDSNSYFTNDYSLTVTGDIIGSSASILQKVGLGQLILPTANSYLGPTDIQQGWVTIQDNQSLGDVQIDSDVIASSTFINSSVNTVTKDPTSISGAINPTVLPTTTVEAGASLQLKPLSAGANLTISNDLVLAGLGISSVSSSFGELVHQGALLSLSGNNDVTGTIQLDGVAGIGVQSHVSEVQTVLVSGAAGGSYALTFNGQTTAPLAYSAPAAAVQSALAGLSSIGSPAVGGAVSVSLSVSSAARLYTVTFGGDLTGTNVPVMTTSSSLTGTSASVTVNTVSDGGILGPTGLSELTLTGPISDLSAATPGGITKFGSERLDIQGAGSYTGPVDVAQGVLRAQNNTALGTSEGAGPGGTTVESGAALELMTSTSQNNGNLQSGIEVWNNQLTLNGAGDAAFDDGTLTNIGGDNVWRGPATLGTSATVDVFENSRLTLLGDIDDAANLAPGGSALTKMDTGELALGGANSYRGTTYVDQGILTVENSQALGATNGGTIVASGAQLQVQGGVTIAGEPLTIQGTGSLQAEVQSIALGGSQSGTFTLTFGGQTTGALAFTSTAAQVETALNALSSIGGIGGSVSVYLTNVDVYSVVFLGSLAGNPQSLLTAAGTGGTTVFVAEQIVGGSAIVALPTWFNIGPSPTDNGQTAGNMPVAGRITSVATDPTDSNAIYVATAGGGVWKTVDGGQTWQPLFDGLNTVQSATVTGGAGSFTLTFEGQTTSSIPAGATIDQMETALDALSTIGGIGGYVSVTQSGSVYTIAFSGGQLADASLPVMTATGTGGTKVTVALVQNGVTSQAAMFTGAIAVAPSSPNVIYLGTGEADASGDSFYGTGVYESTDYGVTWKLVTDLTPKAIANPLYGQAISTLIVDPYNPFTIYLASSDQASNAPAGLVGTPGIWRYNGTSWFNLTATTSTVRETQSSADPNPPGTPPAELPPPMTPGPDDDYRISFPQSAATWSSLDLVYVDTTSLPTTPTGDSKPTPIAWQNAVGSATTTTSTAAGTAYTPSNTLGSSTAVPVLYAALGISNGNTTGEINNGVYWCPNPSTTTKASPPDWYVGDPYTISSNAAGMPTATLTPDVETMGEFPTAWPDPDTRPKPTVPTSPIYGSIKISVFVAPSSKPTMYWPTFQSVTIYATVTNPIKDTLDQILTSSNGGFTWAPIAALPPTNYLGNVGDYDNTIYAVSATTVYVGGELNANISNAGTIYKNPPEPGQAYPSPLANSLANTGQIYETIDGGATWTDLSVDSAGNGPHEGLHSMVLDSQGRLLVGTDGGIWRLDPTTNLWTDLNGDLANQLLVAGDVNPINYDGALAGSSANGTADFSGSPTWAFADPQGASGGEIAVDPLDPSIVYTVVNSLSGYQLQVSAAGGASGSWNTVFSENLPANQQPTLQLGGVFPFALDSINPSRLVVGGVQYEVPSPSPGPPGPWVGFSVNESLNGGASWINLNPHPGFAFQLPVDFTVTHLALATYQGAFTADPIFPLVSDLGANTYDPNTIYVIGFDESTGLTNLYVTKDGGNDWVARKTGLPLSAASTITVDPRNRDTAYVTIPTSPGSGIGRVWMTTDAGQTWTSISSNLPDVPTWTLVIDPRTGNLYVGDDEGVYISTNVGASWQHFGVGMPNVQVRDLVLSQSLNTLTAFTYGRSAFQLFLDDSQTLSGALNAASGSNVWTGPVTLTGTLPGATVSVGAEGSQVLQNGLTTAQITLAGPIGDQVAGGNYQLTKIGQGNVVLSGPNTYGGVTQVETGVLVAGNSQALGNAATPDMQNVTVSGSTAGTFTLTFSGKTTSALAFGSTANQVQMALTALPTIASAGTTATVTVLLTNVLSGSVYTVNFGGSLGESTVPLLVAAGSGGTTAQVNRVTVAGSPTTPVGGIGTLVDSGAALELTSNLQGEPISLQGDGIAFNGHNTGALRSIAGNNTYTGPLTLLTNSTVGVDSGSQLTIGASSTLIGTGTITDGTLSFSLTKELTGTLVLTSANTYKGGTFVNQGAIQIQQANALGSKATTEVLDGAQLQIQTPASGPLAKQPVVVQNQTLNLSGSGIFGTGALEDFGTNTWQGPIVLAANPGFSPPTSPPSTVTFNVPNALDVLTINGSISQAGAANMGLTKIGSGEMVLAQADSYGGTTSINQGIVDIQNGLALGKSGTTTVVANGAALDLDGDPKSTGTGIGFDIYALTLNGTGINNTGAMLNISGPNTWTGGITLASSAAAGLPSLYADGIGVTNGSLTVIGVIGGVATATLNKLDSGTLTLTAMNTYLGLTQVQAGILNIANSSALGAVGGKEQQSFQLTGSENGSYTLTFEGQTTAALPFTAPAATVQSALNSLSTLSTFGPAAVTVTSPSGNPPPTNFTVTFTGLPGINVPQMTGQGSGGTGVTVSTVTDGGGLGVVVASGATLQMRGGINVPGKSLTINGNGVNNAGVVESVSGTNVWSGSVTLASNVTIGCDVIPGLLIFNKGIAGGGFGVTKVGTGTLQFTGTNSNTYSGPTNVNLGTLQLNQTASTPAILGNLTIGVGTPVTPGSSSPPTVQLLTSNQISSTSTLTINDGLFDLTTQTQTIGALSMTGGTVSLTGPASKLTLNPSVGGSNVSAGPDSSGTAATISGSGTLSLGGVTRTFTVNGPATSVPSMIISAVIAGTGSEGLAKAGTGALQLANDNTYTGTTTLSNGYLLADGSNNGTTVGLVSLGGGTLGGMGTVGAVTATSNTSTVAPGDSPTSPGTLTGSTTTWNGITTYFVALDGASAGQFSQFAVNGNINLGNAVLTGAVNGTVAPNSQLPIITTTGGNVAGVFANAAPGSIIVLGGQKFGVTYTTTQVILTAAPKNSANIALVSSANPSVYGQDVTFTATVTPVTSGTGPIPTTDTVTFTLDGSATQTIAINNSGQATFDPLTLTPPVPLTVAQSPHTLKATFNGDGNWNAVTTSLTPMQTVNMANVTVTFSTSPATPVVGQPVTVIATVAPVGPGAGVPTGTITFTEDGTTGSPQTLTAGQGTFMIAALSGQHSFQAAYSGDANFNAKASSTFQLTVPTSSTTTIASSANPSVFGQSVITATVQGPSPANAKPTGGSVTFVVGRSSYPVLVTSANPGMATLPAGDLPVGTESVTATYNGDTNPTDNFLASPASNTLMQVVNKASTNIVVGSSASTSVVGQPVVFTATVSGVGPSTLKPTDGSVTFMIDGVSTPPVALGSANPGVAAITQTFQTTTAHTITASYSGGASFLASGPTSVPTQTVNKAGTTTTLGASANPALTGQSVVFTANVGGNSPSATKPTDGSVTFVVDGTNHVVPLSTANPGVATYTATGLSTTTHAVTARYSGGASFLASGPTPTLNEAVNPPANIIPTSFAFGLSTAVSVKNPFALKVTALNSAGKPTTALNGPATMTIIPTPTTKAGGALTGSLSATFVNGVATFSNLAITTAGTYTVQVSAGGVKMTFTFSSASRRT